ncbi:hypothetical protein BK727_13605 [Bacillus thuringiensis serovar roskildiensis]|uniref:Uncharacterized protein n=2 Tax=Bacillus cereus group TaxID=86661 RepID=A0A2A7DEG0_BACAN|nr:hypothetical protein BK707_13000 [Bacillus thuringiensis serovar coreanensis]OTX47906.1 hypothetical protein BK724_10310 [Bacillus thuringiensis serovar sooncheon]OTX54896.1 hypothetical protein BK725_11320 [Bacillus thuringiensis serovar guiyangiensis]OTX68951.1 hypothetical protein BK727_13605 [Bacillus thuringiensis serovar roskildiensis]PDZ18363.1 hypothetical protein CON16_03790 [Bacillus anthracis]
MGKSVLIIFLISDKKDFGLHNKMQPKVLLVFTIYPALMGSKTPPQNAAKAKKLGGGSTAH